MNDKGVTAGEVQAHLAEIYGVQVSRDTISTITDRVLDSLAEWQSHPLDAVRAVTFIYVISVKIRAVTVANRPIYVVQAVRADGEPMPPSSLTASIRTEVIISRSPARTSQLACRYLHHLPCGHQRRKPAGPRMPVRPAAAERRRWSHLDRQGENEKNLLNKEEPAQQERQGRVGVQNAISASFGGRCGSGFVYGIVAAVVPRAVGAGMARQDRCRLRRAAAHLPRAGGRGAAGGGSAAGERC